MMHHLIFLAWAYPMYGPENLTNIRPIHVKGRELGLFQTPGWESIAGPAIFLNSYRTLPLIA
jgi:hypothetical protein